MCSTGCTQPLTLTAHIGSTPTVTVKWKKMDDSIICLNLHSAWRQYWCTSISFWHYTMTTWDQGDDVRISTVSAECMCFLKNITYNFCDKKSLTFFSFLCLNWRNVHYYLSKQTLISIRKSPENRRSVFSDTATSAAMWTLCQAIVVKTELCVKSLYVPTLSIALTSSG